MKETPKESSLIQKAEAGDKNYLELPTNELLDSFGKGSHIPGSGSAAALSGLIAIEMMKTVIKLTLPKPNYEGNKEQFQYILKKLNEESTDLFKGFFNNDIKSFHKVSYHRRLRDEATEKKEKEKNNRIANEYLKEATDIPIRICEESLNLLDFAIRIFDNAFKSARGDSGVAISNLLSAAQGALFVIFLNLKTFKKSEWKDKRINKSVELARRFTTIQKEAYKRVVSLYNENTDEKQLIIDF